MIPFRLILFVGFLMIVGAVGYGAYRFLTDTFEEVKVLRENQKAQEIAIDIQKNSIDDLTRKNAQTKKEITNLMKKNNQIDLDAQKQFDTIISPEFTKILNENPQQAETILNNTLNDINVRLMNVTKQSAIEPKKEVKPNE